MSRPAILSLILLFSLLHTVLGCGEYCRFTCDYSSNYTTNSPFSSNLAQALRNLQINTGPTGFNATTVGNLTQPATAIGLCRGSLSPSECQTCINAAVVSIGRVCPDNASAQLWTDYCMVRYADVDFLGKASVNLQFIITDSTFAPDPDSYVGSVQLLVQSLSSAASASDKRYAVGRTALLQNRTLYGYFDCTRDLSAADCASCFSSAASIIQTRCITLTVCWILTASCNVQVSMEPAHADWVNAPLYTRNETVGNQLPNATADGGRGNREKDLKGIIVVGVVIGVVLAVGLLLAGLWGIKKRERAMERESSDEMMMRREGINMGPNIFDLDELVAATDKFSASNFLGSGGYGTVYKGRMRNGEDIAVKKLEKNSSSKRLGVFFNEVRVLVNMQHKNLVKMLGYCVHGEERILVYEYLPNRSLDYILFDKTKSRLLDWPKRYNIIVGIARGLQYLHEDSSLKIIHRDIKASNILLDEHMKSKIADFGLAKLFNDENTHIKTRQIAGTFGYMAPEYVNGGVLSMKSDVFSFGVLLLEIMSGRKNYDDHLDDKQRQLLHLAWRLEQEDRVTELVDVTMGSFPEEEARRCIQIGLLCCQESTQDRPTISSAISMLTYTLLPIPQVGRHGYYPTATATATAT